MDTQLDFAADHHVVLKEAVQGVVDRAFSGVFHWHHAKIHRTGRHFTEHFVDGRHRLADHSVAEVLHGRRLGKRTLRTEISNLQRLLKRQARRHDFTEQPRHLFVAQRPLVTLHHAFEHLSFTLGAVEHRHFAFSEGRHLHPCHFLGAPRTFTDQLQDFLIQAVNAYTQGLELLFRH